LNYILYFFVNHGPNLMNIAILSRGAYLYSTQSILRSGERREHNIRIIDPTYCTPGIIDNKPLLFYHDEVLENFDAIIPRVGASITYYGTNIVRHFESMGVFSTVSSQAIINSRDKWTSMQIMAKAKIPVPKTILGSGHNVQAILETMKSDKMIIKLLEGTHGQGVILTESYRGTLALIEALQTANVKFLVQEYIEESKGADLRAIVVDGVVVASMRRQGQEGEFRSNLHRGGSSEKIQLSFEEEKIALQAARSLQMGVCGVDILQTNNGPVVLEVNSSPGLEGIETTTGKNISRSIISYIERSIQRR